MGSRSSRCYEPQCNGWSYKQCYIDMPSTSTLHDLTHLQPPVPELYPQGPRTRNIHLYKNPSMCVLVLTLLDAAINELCSGGPLSARAWMHWGGIEVGI